MKLSSELLALQGCLDGLQEAVWLVNALTQRIIFANAAAAKLARQPAENFAGQHVLEIAATPQDAAFWNQPAQAIAQGMSSLSALLRSDGVLLSVEQRVAAFSFPGLDPMLVMGMVDRSGQQAEHSKQENLLAQLRATLDSVADGILVCGLDGNVHAFNRQLAHLWKMPATLLARDDDAVHAFMAASVSDPNAHAQRLRALVLEPGAPSSDLIALRDGRTLERRSVPQVCLGNVTGRVFSFRDITAELELQDDLRLTAQVFEHSTDAVFIADCLHRLLRLNPAGEALLGQPLQKLQGCKLAELFESTKVFTDHDNVSNQVQETWDKNEVWCSEISVLGAAGPCAMHLSWVALCDTTGQMVRSIGFLRNVSEQQKVLQQIEALACTDPLTGLPDQILLAQRVGSATPNPKSLAKNRFAVLYLGLNHSKIISNSLARTLGDRVLQLVSARLQSVLRPGDLLCRQSEEVFVIYLHDCPREMAETVVCRVVDEMRRPFILNGIGFAMQCSMGAAMCPQDGEALDDLIELAEKAMHYAKNQGRDRHGFYHPETKAMVLQRMQMEHAMRHALGHGRMSVHYQPLVQFGSDAIIGAEALLRWTDPQLGLVPPAVFIGLAEETGYIVTLGRWVLEQAVQQAASWQHAGTPIVVSVNVSALEFCHPDFVEKLSQLLQRHDLPAKLLELELIESILLEDPQYAVQRLAALAALGISISIDCFGFGYFSLAQLKELPIRRLKIDQSFVHNLGSDADTHAMVSTIVHIGQALCMDVVAKGVETQAQRAMLQGLGCDGFQGYLCAPALTPTAFGKLLKERIALGQLERKPFQSM